MELLGFIVMAVLALYIVASFIYSRFASLAPSAPALKMWQLLLLTPYILFLCAGSMVKDAWKERTTRGVDA
jgi:hypothetical protein